MSKKRKTRTPKTQHKTVLFAAAGENEWAENRKEYVPNGTFMYAFAICLAITSGLGVGYVLSRKMAGIEVDASGAICPEPCQFYHAVPHQKAKLTAVIICDAIKGRTSTKLHHESQRFRAATIRPRNICNQRGLILWSAEFQCPW